MSEPSSVSGRARTVAGVVALLAVLAIQLLVSMARDTSSWDEGDHIYAGYRSWTHKDYGLNPEHPPLIKLLATAPLLAMPLKVPPLQDRFFMTEAFLGGKDLLYDNDADAVLWRAHVVPAILSLLMCLVAFLAAREMFGTAAGFVALALLVFDPSVIAHGARVTTDTGVSLFLFASTWAFYRYVKAPSLARLALVGVAAGLALASKHTGIFVLPTLALLAATELLPKRGEGDAPAEPFGRRAVRLAGAVAASGLVAVAILWATYGFRFASRPDGLAINPPLAEFVTKLSPFEASLLTTAASWRLLPESYVYGLAVVKLYGWDYHSYALGTIYPHRVWWYFPLAFSIKTTLGFLGLFALSLFAIVARRFARAREVLYLTIPPALYFLVAMTSGMNIGVRHILPVYVYLAVLAGGAAAALARANRRWVYAVGALLLMHVASSAFAFPNYMPYANEAWGGSSQTYRYLTDSSVDWAQQLKSVKKYCDENHVTRGYFAYFGEGVLEPKYYGIPLEPIPTADSLWIGEPIQVAPAIDGPVFISAGVLSGWEFGPGALDPYAQFRSLKPVAVIDHAIFVYDGHFEIPLASALGRAQASGMRLAEGKNDEALAEAEAAVALAPDSATTLTARGDALAALGRTDEAKADYARALEIARTVEPAFQEATAAALEEKLK